MQTVPSICRINLKHLAFLFIVSCITEVCLPLKTLLFPSSISESLYICLLFVFRILYTSPFIHLAAILVFSDKQEGTRHTKILNVVTIKYLYKATTYTLSLKNFSLFFINGRLTSINAENSDGKRSGSSNPNFYKKFWREVENNK